MQFTLNGSQVDIDDDGATLLDVLRERFGIRSVKDGCAPQGQCGCCTVLVDGSPRVACVTPARRIAGREVTTLEGLHPTVRTDWAGALTTTGGSQCGFCTPGIVMRLSALTESERADDAKVETALLAHLCRCTGWQSICEATRAFGAPDDTDRVRSRSKSQQGAVRAALEGGSPQRTGPEIAQGAGGFADDTAPADALVAMLGHDGEWVVGETHAEARHLAAKVQGRRTTLAPTPPLELPEGEWDVSLRTSWIEPAYLEPDASWCVPGGEPATPLANGGAFGGKVTSVAPAIARRLADEHGRAVRVVLSREDTVRLGPKRPPIAAGIRADGTGTIRVVRTPGVVEAIHAANPDLVVEEVDVPGPSTSAALRAAGWAEAAIVTAAARNESAIDAPNGSRATATIDVDGNITVRVAAGDPLDEVVLRSYAIGAAHMALGWVTSEGLAVDEDGEVLDLTIRSFGILRARDMPEVTIEIDTDDDQAPMNGSDAVFAAVALAAWRARGLPPRWPTERGSFT